MSCELYDVIDVIFRVEVTEVNLLYLASAHDLFSIIIG